MSITNAGFEFEKSKAKRGIAMLVFLTILEGVFSFFLYLAVAGKIFSPEPGEAAAGVPQLLSYQGRLTDTSGNPLGGAGTAYCFQYSIYDAASGGNKVWPSGTPSNSTTTVADGVFNDQIGRTDALNLNMFATSTLYLNVSVNRTTSTCAGVWEDLVPRQQITASGYALASQDIFGNYIRTITGTNNKIQIGLGTGSPTVFLSLDQKNTADLLGGSCSDNGSLWYNSVNTRALICENGTIQTISNSSTTVAGIGTNASTPITAGSVVFSNSNGVTFGQNGSTVTASVNAGGGNIFSSTILGQKYNWQSTSASLGQNTLYLFPEAVNASIAASVVKIPVALTVSSNTSASRQVGYTAQFGVYTRNATNSTVLSRLYSTSYTLALSWNSNTSMALSMITAVGNSTSYNTVASTSTNGIALSSLVHGVREFIMPWNTTLAPGEYWFGLLNSSSSAGGAIASALSASYIVATSATNAAMGVATSNVSNFNLGRNIGYGSYSATTGAMPAAISITQIARTAINPIIYMLSVTQ